MKKILVLLFVIVLGLTGCSMNVAPQMFEEKNNIEWISNNRAATTLDEITVEVYRVPIENTMHNGEEYQYTKTLHRGEKLRVETPRDYNYKYYSCIRVVEFNSYSLFCNDEDEIYIFDYDSTVGMEVSLNWGGPLKTKNKVKHNEWKFLSNRICHRDDVEGYEDYYYFLDNNALTKFYEEHKDGERIVWDN